MQDHVHSEPLLISEAEAAYLLGFSRATLKDARLGRRKTCPFPKAHRIGGRIRYLKQDILDFVAALGDQEGGGV